MKVLRIFIKIVLFPVSLLLSIIAAFSMFVITTLSCLLSIASGICTLGALITWSQYFFGWPLGTAGDGFTLKIAIIVSVFAYLFSPYGFPLFGMWLVAKINHLNSLIKSI